MPKVEVKSGMSIDGALRRLKRVCEKAGIPTRSRQKSAYEKPTEKRKREKAVKKKRLMKKQMKEREAREKHRRLL